MTFWCQLYLTNGFGDCGCSYNKVLWKTIENVPFSQKFRKYVECRHNGCFCCFQVRHSYVFTFRWILIQLTHSYLQLTTLYWFANQHTRFIPLIQYGHRKQRKTVNKLKSLKIWKKTRLFLLIWICWWRIWPYLGRPVLN